MQHNTQIHPVGDLVFNPVARTGDPDWRVMYIGVGDGGSGEQKDLTMRHNPQRLDTLVGKILRIIPDPSDRQSSSIAAPNGRYRIPNDNPFVRTAGARGEIWAYGLRNPHRLTWVVEPPGSRSPRLFAMSIGMHTWETINIVKRGANFGYSEREGNEAMGMTNLTEPRPKNDRLPIRITGELTRGTIAPSYPVLQYNHGQGLAILGGYLYQGANLPALRGRFIFGDIATGRLYSAAYADLLRADDGDPDSLAPFAPISLEWDDPADRPDAGVTPHPTMAPIVFAGYEARKRAQPGVQAAARPTRADIRLAMDGSGELYVLSKVDGMIRRVIGASATK
jgi:glucose/arabinose dehydrogenase